MIGGGFIKCQVIASLRRVGAEVDVVEMLPGAAASGARSDRRRHRRHCGVIIKVNQEKNF